MRPPAPRTSPRGGALILTLLFMGAITAGFVTWAGIIRQRARLGDFEEHQAKKRLSAINTKVLARDYMLRRVLASNGDDDGLTSYANGNTYSTGTLTSWDGNSQISTTNWTGYPLDSSTRLAGINAFSPTFDYPYSKSFTFTASNKLLSYRDMGQTTNPGREEFSEDTTTIRSYLRSRNLLLGGDLLVLHRPTVNTTLPAVTGNVAVYGRVVHFAPDISVSNYTARSERFTSPAAVSGGTPSAINVVPATIAGSANIWSNLAWSPISTGNATNSDLNSTTEYDWRLPDLTGQLNFIDNTNNISNSLKAELIASGSTLQPTGTATWTDSRGVSIPSGSTRIATISPCLGPGTSDLPSVVLNNVNTANLTEIIINGQAGTEFNNYAQYRPSMAVVYTQSNSGSNLTTIRLRNQNRRRMILALKKDHRSSWPSPATTPAVNLIVETTGTSSEWHLLILCENVPLNITYTNVATWNLTGGIETNAPLYFPASPKLCTISLQTDTRGLIRMSPRAAWVETFLTGNL